MEIEEVMAEAKGILNVADPHPVLVKATALSTQGLFSFESRNLILEDIMTALKDETTKSIGVFGFGGMGKTTLAIQIAARADEDKMFEDIVIASVTQTVELKKIQEKIASMLGLNVKNSTEAESAGRIYERLKGKKVLVILDDLWKELDLNDVGVPFGTEHMGCKILLTSRFRSVLTSMGIQKDLHLEALKKEEAWRLFEEKVGGSVLTNSEFLNIGKEVAKRCQGLPVLIVTVATSLSKRPQLSAWNDALRQLKEMDNKQMHDIVNFAIESISYNHLKKTHKQLFLLCGIIGGDASIEEVLQYSWGLDLFDEESVTIQAARDRLHNLIFDLKESCLLLDNVDSRNSIKMHDVVRDVAISIGSKDLNMFSMKEHGVELNIWRKDDDLKRCTSMVLRGCPNIPPTLECPLLELFVMSGNYSSSIPESFFEKTVKLKVLGMSRLSFSVLPPSLSFLTNLQTLRVNYCGSLKNISIVGELKKLQILSIASCTIDELPSGIGQLSELRSLDVRGCSELKVIPAGLIEGLTRLEELYVTREFNRCEAEERVNGSVKTNASLRELKHLHNLSSLEVRAKDDKFLLEDIHFEKLERYEIIVGDFDNWWWLDSFEVTRKFCVQLSSINHLPQGFKRLFEKAECLWLEELRGFKNVTPALDGDVSSNSKHLRIIKDDGGVNINDGVPEEIEFAQLRMLTLKRLPKLKNFFCNGEMQNKSHKSQSPNLNTKDEEEELKSILPFFTKVSFPELEKLELSEIYNFKYLLTSSVAMGLVKLKSLEVEDCAGMKHLVVAEEEGETLNFPQLRKLSLLKLPNLTAIYSVMDSNDTQPPISKKVLFPKLEELKVSEISNLTEIWSHVFQETSCCNLTRLTINACKSLKHVFPAHVAPSLNKLEFLNIQDCEEVETIICDENYAESQEEIIKAAQHEHAAATFMLTYCNVTDCGNLSIFDFLSFPPKEGDDQFEKVVSKLEYLSIRSTELKKIRDLYGHFPPHLFSSLKRLQIVGSDVFPSEFLGIIHKQLRYFTVYNCSFQEIFPYEGEFTNHANDHTLFFPHLIWLRLDKLPELKYICKDDQKKSFMLNILGRLKYICVIECPLLTNLVQPSATRCLEKLCTLTISECKKMEKVIGDDDDELSRDDDNEIIFPNLYMLKLEKLPRLRSFCSSPNYTFNFPKLIYVSVRECPNMKTFCEGITTTPELKKVYCEGGEERCEGDLNTTIQKVFAETEAKRLGASLPSTSLSNHVEGNDPVLENSSEELNEPIPTVVCQNQEKAIVPYTREKGKGKGKEPEVSEEVMEHLDPSTHSYTAREQIVAGSVASSSKLSSHSEEFHERLIPSTSSSSNNQEAEIHDQTAEPTKEYQICNQVVTEISVEGTFTETRIATEISEDGAEKSATLEVRELAPLLPSTSSNNYTEAAAQVPDNSTKAQNDATNADKMADTFEKGSLPSSEETDPPAQTTLSRSTELEVRRSTSTVESEATDPKKGSEIDEEVLQGVKLADNCDKTQEQLQKEICDQEVVDAHDGGKGKEYDVPEESEEPRNETSHCLETEPETITASSSSHQESFRGLRESFQLLEAQPMSRVSAEQVRFMEEASKWFSGYVQQAREYLEQKELISEYESKIDDMEAQLQALKEKKRVAEEKKKAASRVAKFG